MSAYNIIVTDTQTRACVHVCRRILSVNLLHGKTAFEAKTQCVFSLPCNFH